MKAPIKPMFIILAVLSVLTAWPYISEQITGRMPKKDPLIASLQEFTKNNTNRITISKGLESIDLTRDGQNWQVGSHSASLDSIDGLFSALSGAKSDRIVSRNIANQTEYGISSDSATLLTLQGSNRSESVYIGFSGPESGTFYLRNKMGELVYLMYGAIPEAVSVSESSWRDKKILRVNEASVATVTVTGKKSFILSKDSKGVWTIGSATIEESKAKEAIRVISTLDATDFGTDDDVKVFTDADLPITVTLTDEKKAELAKIILVEKESEYLTMREGAKEVLKVPVSTLSALFSLAESK